MKSFLEEVAEKVSKQYPKLESLTIVLPNRRAALFFRKYLGDQLTRPAFSPRILTIEDFIREFSLLRVPDKLILINYLHQAYKSIVLSEGGGTLSPLSEMEKFYFWGEMLLRDFDEIDRCLLPARKVFTDLRHQKELDAEFDFLTDEQKRFLHNFWDHFDTDKSENKNRFILMWEKLAGVYDEFNKLLASDNLAYEGRIQRQVALSLGELFPKDRQAASGPVLFAGFNALTPAEEKVIAFFVETVNAQIFWDVDAYYVNNNNQKAGFFFRKYQQHPLFRNTFPADLPANIQKKINERREVKLYGAPQPIGQVKLMSQIIKEEIDRGMKPGETIIVLADEKLLLPVLHGVAGAVNELNVTMGFPLANTPLFNFIELLIDLQISRKENYFNHRQVLGLLGHPYMAGADAVAATNKRKEIVKNNWIMVPAGFLASETDLQRIVFRSTVEQTRDSYGMIQWLKEIVQQVGIVVPVDGLDREYVFHFLKLLNLLESVLANEQKVRGVSEGRPSDIQDIKAFLRLFRQLVRMTRIPFSGEPLKGLQIMGVLETRNLDFKNVFVLSLNEGAFPAHASQGSYIPQNIRKAYGLPTPAEQDAMYAYLFYRLLQRAENVYLFYNSETDVLGQGEMSRYVQQLIYESGLNVKKQILHNPIQPQRIGHIVIQKTENLLQQIYAINEGNQKFKGISPSALNSYIDCRLQFYFKFVARIREPNEVEEELDARVLGNFLHDVMENFYRDIVNRKGSKLIEKKDLENASTAIDKLIDRFIIENYRLDPAKPVEYGGQRLVVREVVRIFALKILDMDRGYAPFDIEALEHGDLTYTVALNKAPFKAVLGGKIDRVDRKENVIRIIDYKTGKDESNFDSISSLFARDSYRNKAAFQTVLYALMFSRASGGFINGNMRPRLVPGLINRMNIFTDFNFGLQMRRQRIENVEDVFPEFEEHLKNTLEELFDPLQPFDQTINTSACRYCSYREICYRQ